MNKMTPPNPKCEYCQQNNLPCPDYIAVPLHPLMRPIDSPKPDPNNTNAHTSADIYETAKSIKKFKQRGPITLNDFTGLIEAGEGRWLAMKKLGYEYIAVVGVQDDTKTAIAYSIADNVTAKGSKLDPVKLKAALGKLKETPPGITEAIKADLQSALQVDYQPVLTPKMSNGKVEESDIEHAKNRLNTAFEKSTEERAIGLVEVICPNCTEFFNVRSKDLK